MPQFIIDLYTLFLERVQGLTQGQQFGVVMGVAAVLTLIVVGFWLLILRLVRRRRARLARKRAAEAVELKPWKHLRDSVTDEEWTTISMLLKESSREQGVAQARRDDLDALRTAKKLASILTDNDYRDQIRRESATLTGASSAITAFWSHTGCGTLVDDEAWTDACLVTGIITRAEDAPRLTAVKYDDDGVHFTFDTLPLLTTEFPWDEAIPCLRAYLEAPGMTFTPDPVTGTVELVLPRTIEPVGQPQESATSFLEN